jgi:hypothetical protein
MDNELPQVVLEIVQENERLRQGRARDKKLLDDLRQTILELLEEARA